MDSVESICFAMMVPMQGKDLFFYRMVIIQVSCSNARCADICWGLKVSDMGLFITFGRQNAYFRIHVLLVLNMQGIDFTKYKSGDLHFDMTSVKQESIVNKGDVPTVFTESIAPRSNNGSLFFDISGLKNLVMDAFVPPRAWCPKCKL